MAKIRSSALNSKPVLWLALIVVFVCGSVLIITACIPTANNPTQQQDSGDQPDCDFDDVLERDTDCGFTKQSKKPAPKVTVKQPAPRITRR